MLFLTRFFHSWKRFDREEAEAIMSGQQSSVQSTGSSRGSVMDRKDIQHATARHQRLAPATGKRRGNVVLELVEENPDSPAATAPHRLIESWLGGADVGTLPDGEPWSSK